MLGIPTGIDVWCTTLETDRYSVLESVLTDDERRQASRFRFERDRRRYVVRHAQLRRVLSHYLDCTPSEVPFVRSPSGKPGVCDSAIAFSMSHSGELALYAVAAEGFIGCDIERLDCRLASEETARLALTDREREVFALLPRDAQTMHFFRSWTRKEAWLKARGDGLMTPMTAIEISNRHPLRFRRLPQDDMRDWLMADLEVPGGYVAALVARRTSPISINYRSSP